MNNSERIYLVIEKSLMPIARISAIESAERIIKRYMQKFSEPTLKLHLKKDGPQMTCNMTLVTEKGKYYASSKSWDVQLAVQHALKSIDFQVDKNNRRYAVY